MLSWSASSVNLTILLCLDVCLFSKNKCHNFTVHNIPCASFILTVVIGPSVNINPVHFCVVKYCTFYKTLDIVPYFDCWLPLGHIMQYMTQYFMYWVHICYNHWPYCEHEPIDFHKAVSFFTPPCIHYIMPYSDYGPLEYFWSLNRVRKWH